MGEDPRRVPPRDPRADRLHAAVVRPLPGPHDARERRLRRVAVRAAVVASAATDARGPPVGRPVGRQKPACRPTVRRDAAPARAGVGARPRPCRSPSSTSRQPGSTHCCAPRSGRSWADSATPGRTLLVTTQYVNEAESCDAVVLISEGRVDRDRHAGRAAADGDGRRRRRHRHPRARSMPPPSGTSRMSSAWNRQVRPRSAPRWPTVRRRCRTSSRP